MARAEARAPRAGEVSSVQGLLPWSTRLVNKALIDTREGGTSLSLTPHIRFAAGRRGGRRSNNKVALDPGIRILAHLVLIYIARRQRAVSALAPTARFPCDQGWDLGPRRGAGGAGTWLVGGARLEDVGCGLSSVETRPAIPRTASQCAYAHLTASNGV